jgi:hypothetical protein
MLDVWCRKHDDFLSQAGRCLETGGWVANLLDKQKDKESVNRV